MSEIIAVTNQKGGVGKTTTSINLAASLANKGYKVLLIDIDPQGNATTGLGVYKKKVKNTVYDFMLDQCSLKKALHKTKQKNLFLMPSNMSLAGAEIELSTFRKKEYLLTKAFKEHMDDFDYILMDCPPSLNVLTINALTFAESILVPVQCEYFALEGLTQLMHTIKLVKKNLNPQLKIDGLVFTMYDSRTNLSEEVIKEVKKHITKHIYNTVIPRNIKLAEAPSYGLPINLYDKNSKGAKAYSSLADEFIKKGDANEKK